MQALLEVILSFIGAVLLLALASQSLIELVKATFPIEGFTRMGSAKRLLAESARACGLSPSDAETIYGEVSDRLRHLGQRGWFGVRLDCLTAGQLKDLINSVSPEELTGLEGLDRPQKLRSVADRVEAWFELAMTPVSERYRRRMRVTNLISAAVVVIALNVDAFGLMERVRTDREFRASMLTTVGTLDTLLTRADSLERILAVRVAEAQTDSAGAAVTQPPEIDDELLADLDSAMAAAQTFAAGQTALFSVDGERRWGEGRWWLGILLTTLLVSLGAPFWHDLLGTVFGLRQITARRASGGEIMDGGGPTRPPSGPRSGDVDIQRVTSGDRNVGALITAEGENGQTR